MIYEAIYRSATDLRLCRRALGAGRECLSDQYNARSDQLYTDHDCVGHHKAEVIWRWKVCCHKRCSVLIADVTSMAPSVGDIAIHSIWNQWQRGEVKADQLHQIPISMAKDATQILNIKTIPLTLKQMIWSKCPAKYQQKNWLILVNSVAVNVWLRESGVGGGSLDNGNERVFSIFLFFRKLYFVSFVSFLFYLLLLISEFGAILSCKWKC